MQNLRGVRESHSLWPMRSGHTSSRIIPDTIEMDKRVSLPHRIYRLYRLFNVLSRTAYYICCRDIFIVQNTDIKTSMELVAHGHHRIYGILAPGLQLPLFHCSWDATLFATLTGWGALCPGGGDPPGFTKSFDRCFSSQPRFRGYSSCASSRLRGLRSAQ